MEVKTVLRRAAWKAAVLTLVTASLTRPHASWASQEDHDTGRLELSWCDPHRLVPFGGNRVGAETARIYSAIGVRILWKKCPGEGEALERAGPSLRVLLVRSEPERWGLPPLAMGALLSRAEPQPTLYIFFAGIARTLGYPPQRLAGRLLGAREKRDLARALSRVVAHEAFHALLPSLRHGETGLTRPYLDRAFLLAARTPIHPEHAELFRDALEQAEATMDRKSTQTQVTAEKAANVPTTGDIPARSAERTRWLSSISHARGGDDPSAAATLPARRTFGHRRPFPRLYARPSPASASSERRAITALLIRRV